MLDKKVMFVLVFFLAASFAWAADFDVALTPVNDKIFPNGVAEFNVLIKNNMNSEKTFSIYSLDSSWDVSTKPFVNPITLTLGAKKAGSIIVFIKPAANIVIGTYDAYLNVKDISNEGSIRAAARISILPTEQEKLGYVPTVLADVMIDKEIDPRQKISIKLNLDNQNILDIESLTVIIESNLIKDVLNQSIGPKEKKTIEITKSIDPSTSPQKDKLKVTLKIGDKIIEGPIEKDYEVIGYADLKSSQAEKYGFLSKTKEITYTNNGNIAYSGELSTTKPLYKRPFTKVIPKAAVKRQGGNDVYYWQATIAPGETFKISVFENYIALLAILVVVAAIIIFIFYTRIPLSLTKKVGSIEATEGGVTRFKITINVKNRSSAEIKDLSVIDIIPKVAIFEEEVGLGGLHPSKVMKHQEKGTIIKWDIDLLGAGEERVIHYRVKSSLSILGGFNLPAAIATLKVNGKDKNISSNRLTVKEEAKKE